jgi:hypothetical protein
VVWVAKARFADFVTIDRDCRSGCDVKKRDARMRARVLYVMYSTRRLSVGKEIIPEIKLRKQRNAFNSTLYSSHSFININHSSYYIYIHTSAPVGSDSSSIPSRPCHIFRRLPQQLWLNLATFHQDQEVDACQVVKAETGMGEFDFSRALCDLIQQSGSQGRNGWRLADRQNLPNG